MANNPKQISFDLYKDLDSKLSTMFRAQLWSGMYAHAHRRTIIVLVMESLLGTVREELRLNV